MKAAQARAVTVKEIASSEKVVEAVFPSKTQFDLTSYQSNEEEEDISAAIMQGFGNNSNRGSIQIS